MELVEYTTCGALPCAAASAARTFHKQAMPFDIVETRYVTEVDRCGSLWIEAKAIQNRSEVDVRNPLRIHIDPLCSSLTSVDHIQGVHRLSTPRSGACSKILGAT